MSYGVLDGPRCFAVETMNYSDGRSSETRAQELLLAFPSGWRVAFKEQAKDWTIETGYDSMDRVCFKCALRDSATGGVVVESAFREKPTTSFREAYKLAFRQETAHRPNGSLFTGLTYSNIQMAIFEHFRHQADDGNTMFGTWLRQYLRSDNSVPVLSPPTPVGKSRAAPAAVAAGPVMRLLGKRVSENESARPNPERDASVKDALSQLSSSAGGATDFKHMAEEIEGMWNKTRITTHRPEQLIWDEITRGSPPVDDAAPVEDDKAADSFRALTAGIVPPRRRPEFDRNASLGSIVNKNISTMSIDEWIKSDHGTLRAGMSASDVFTALKKPGDVYLDREQLYDAVRFLLGMNIKHDLVDRLWASCDKNRDGKVTLDEFVAAMTDRERELEEQFRELDRDGSGTISMSEIEHALTQGRFTESAGGVVDPDAVRELVRTFDLALGKDSGLEITWSEFRAVMLLFPPASSIKDVLHLVQDLDEDRFFDAVALDDDDADVE